MAMAAASLPQVRVQHPPSQLPLSGKLPRPGRPSSLQQLRAPKNGLIFTNSPERKLHLQRLHKLILHAGADVIPMQEEEARPSLTPEEEDAANCREIRRVLQILNDKRDMPFNEVRLIVMIEDPTEREEREQYNIENERGCSREDMAAALVDVYEGRVPSDRKVLRELYKEMIYWPNLEDESETQKDPTQSPYARTTDTGVDPRVAAQKMKFDFDAAAEIEPGAESEDSSVPPVLEGIHNIWGKGV